MFYGGMAVDKNNSKTEEEKKVSVSLRENEAYIRKRCENCGDIVIRPMRLGKERKADCLMVYLEVATANMMLETFYNAGSFCSTAGRECGVFPGWI